MTKMFEHDSDTPSGLKEQTDYLRNVIVGWGGDQFSSGKISSEKLDAGFKKETVQKAEQVIKEVGNASKPASIDKLPGTRF